MIKTLNLTVILCFIGAALFAQPYGNEWIDYSKTHYKLKVGEDGMYRVVPSDLPGFTSSASDISNFKLFNKGAEVSIYVYDANLNGQFDGTDFVEFYGEHNDGGTDTPLFSDNKDGAGNTPLNHQAHPHKSLFSDTAFYYLVVSTASGMRYSEHDGSSISGTAESYYIHRTRSILTDRYHYGRLILQRSYRSDYNEGEGWVGLSIGKGSNRTYTLSTPNVVSTGPAASFKSVILGDSKDNAAASPDHHAKLEYGPSPGSLNALYDSSFAGYTPVNVNKSLVNANLGSSTTIKYSVVDNLGLSDDDQSACFFEICYPRDFNLGNSSFRFLKSLVGTSGSSRLTFTNYNKSEPLIFDLDNKKRIRGSFSGSTFDVMVPGAGTAKVLVLADSTDFLTPSSIKSVLFKDYFSSPRDYEFLLVTNKRLLSGARTYAMYRADGSVLGGGGYDTLIVTKEELEDQFSFGIVHHPLALRHFAEYMVDQQAVDPLFLFLLGKGMQTDLLNDARYYERNMVTCYGAFGSDNMMTYGANGVEYDPLIPVGRISAKTSQEVLDYLAKVKTYEHSAPAEWQHNVFGVSGGNKSYEPPIFGGYIDEFMDELVAGSTAPNIFRYDLDLNKAQPENPKDLVISKVDSGLLMYSYFGHGADLSIAVELGSPTEYDNYGKYPLMFFSGCRVGNAFGADVSTGESFILEKDKGAVGWLAQTDLGYQTFLREWGILFCKYLSQNYYGSPIGKVVQKVSDDYPIVSDLSMIHAQMTLLQQDPAVRITNYTHPDFKVSSVEVQEEAFNAASDSVTLFITIANIGKYLLGTQDVSISHTDPNGGMIVYPAVRVENPQTHETFAFSVDLRCNSFAGMNQFSINVDAASEHVELNEANNSLNWSLDIPLNDAQLISPIEYSIVSSASTNLVFQPGNLADFGKTFNLQIDTSHIFDSPWKMSTNISPMHSEGVWNVALPFNNQVYYWRAKLSTSANYPAEYSSFTNILGSAKGWNQGDYGQLTGAHTNLLAFDDLNETVEFVRDQAIITSKVNRALVGPPGSNIGLRIDEKLKSGGWSCGHKFVGLHVGGVDLKEKYYINCNGNRPRVTFNIANAAGRTDLVTFINSTLATGEYLALMSIQGGGQYVQLDPALMIAMESLGADTSMIKTLTNSHNYALVGRKGFPADVKEDTSFTIGSYDERAIAIFVAETKWREGAIMSEKIGPAASYASFDYNFIHRGSSSNDHLRINVLGVKVDGSVDSIIKNVTSPPIALNGISATTYPYLRIHAYMADSVDRTAPLIDNWKVLYEGKYETGIYLDAAYFFNNDTISLNDSLKLAYKLKNFSPTVSDSIDVQYQIVNMNSGAVIFTQTSAIAPIGASSTVNMYFSRRMVSAANIGDFRLDVSAIPRIPEKEGNLENNSQSWKLHIKVSNPLPLEAIQLSGAIQNKSQADLKWRTITSSKVDYFNLDRIDAGRQNFEFLANIPGTATTGVLENHFVDQLGKLASGNYSYRVTGVDQKGNQIYSNIISLNLVRESSLSLYPNPSSDRIFLKIYNGETEEAALLEVKDMLGRTVLNKWIIGINSYLSSTRELGIENLASGTYQLSIQIGNRKMTKELIKR